MKDTNNLLPYNVWSGGDYDQSLSDFAHIQTSTITNKYSAIGENSVTLSRIGDLFWINIPLSPITTGTYIFSQYLLNKSNDNIRVRFYTDSTIISYVTVPPSDNWQKINLSVPISNLNGTFYIRILNNDSESTIYIDNNSFTKSI